MKQQTQTNELSIDEQASHIGGDLKNAILIVSLLVNLVVLIGWIAVQVSTRYHQAVASIIFG